MSKLYLYCDWCRCVMAHRRMNQFEAACMTCRTFRGAPALGREQP